MARADEIIKNTYRTLMTRGMKGCYIYCTDAGLRKYLRHRLPENMETGSSYDMRLEKMLAAEKMEGYGIKNPQSKK